MTSRERVLKALRHEEPDRVPIHDGPWGTTIARWRKEGLPENVSPAEYFGYEFRGFSADLSLRFPSETIEDTDTYTLVRNANGATVKNWKHQTSTPEMVDFTIKTPDDWEKHRHRYEFTPERINWDTLEQNRAAVEAGYFVTFNAPVGYDKTQGIVGTENLLMALALEPDWAKDMFECSVQVAMDACRAMLDGGFHFDAAFLYDDLGYRNGLLFSNDVYSRLLKPAHARIIEFFHDHDMPVILHSCGGVKDRIPHFIEIGLDCLQPLEVKAGMDLFELKPLYGDRMAFMGGIDVRKMADPDPEVAQEEVVTKIELAKQGGGYIYHSDHSVPDDISFSRYCQVMEWVKQAGKYE